MMVTSPLGSMIMSPMTHGIILMTHFSAGSVILIHPHVVSVVMNCPLDTTALVTGGEPPQANTSASVGLGFRGSSTDEPASG
jgi:hypothetical protein